MFNLPVSFESAKKEFHLKVEDLTSKGYNIQHSKHPVYKEYEIDKIVISPQKTSKNKLIFTSGLHGAEAYVGHAAIITVLTHIDDYINKNIEVIIYHTVNPYGMINSCRVNENNVDLNRNFFTGEVKLEPEEVDDVNKLYSPQRHKSPFRLFLKFFFKYIQNVLSNYKIFLIRLKTC